MSIVFYILGVIVFVIIAIVVTGFILPNERIVSHQSVFNVSPDVLYKVIVDNHDWKYRSNLKDLIIVEQSADMEVWDEISQDGSVIRFRTKDKIPYSFYSFYMEAKLFTGYWTGEFLEKEDGRTKFIATEYIRVKNPFIKTLSYLFFDVKKFMEIYQEDLRGKINEINSQLNK